MMELDKSRIYTAANADELKVGSRVYAADCLLSLKKAVEGTEQSDVYTITAILGEDNLFRFVAEDRIEWALVYLIEEPEEKKLKWTDLKVGDVIRRKDGKISTMIVTVDRRYDTSLHILAGSWLSDKDLAEWEKVEE